MTEDAVDPSLVRASAASADPDVFISEIRGTATDHALQRIGAAMLRVAWTSPQSRPALIPVMAEVADHARQRDGVGDVLLADDLTTLGVGRNIEGTVLLIDLEELADSASDHGDYPGGYLNLRTGEVIPAVLTDPDIIGEDAAVDIDESEDDWLHVLFESHDSWNDMDEFASTVTDPRVRASLQRALHGRRPFEQFRDVVHRAEIARAWYDFEEERQFGRLRDLLAHDHVHPV